MDETKYVAVPVEPIKEMLAPIAAERWPEDWDVGKKLQRERGWDVVPPNCEMEVAVGQYARMLAAAPTTHVAVKRELLERLIAECERCYKIQGGNIDALAKYGYGMIRNELRAILETP